MQAAGLQTYIWNNNLKSIALLAGFPFILLLLTYAGLILAAGIGATDAGAVMSVSEALGVAAARLPAAAPLVGVAAVGWFGVAFFAHQAIIDASTGAKRVTREAEPELYNLLENLCISRGMTTPALRIIETPARNAFASGLREEAYTVSVTRGLMDALETDELEAVLAHELTHIRNRDVRLLVIAVVFTGIVSFVFEMVFRALTRTNVTRTSSRGRRSGGVNAGALVLIALALLALAYGLSIVIRFALSRRREFMADAGAVELTRNPDAMIGALQKIAGQADMPNAPSEVREMFFENRAKGFGGLLATHPPIDKRIEALVAYGGGRIEPVSS